MKPRPLPSPRLAGLLVWLTLVVLGVVGLTLAARGMASVERHVIFFPDRLLAAHPASVGLDYEDVWFDAADGVRLHGWLVPGDPGKPLVLFAHGNAGNISHRLENLRLLHRLGVPVFLFDYRGYGRSDGDPTEAGTYADFHGAIALLKTRGWQPPQLIYFGRSLGAAVALEAALETPPGALVLESPFTSIADMGRHHHPLLWALGGSWALTARYDNRERIGQLRAPLLLICGEADTVVPPAMGEALFALAPEPKTLLKIPGAGHDDTFLHDAAAYEEAWRQLIGRFARLQP